MLLEGVAFTHYDRCRTGRLEQFHVWSGATGGLSARVSGGTGSKLPVAPAGAHVKPL